MPFNQNKLALKRQPCNKNCTKRAPGCAITCPDWAAYVKARDADYKARADKMRVNDAVHDGYRRLSQMAPKR